MIIEKQLIKSINTNFIDYFQFSSMFFKISFTRSYSISSSSILFSLYPIHLISHYEPGLTAKSE